MAGYPTVQWNVRPPLGHAPARTIVPLLHSPHHGIALDTMPAQRTWMHSRLTDLGATGGDLLSIATVARQKPAR